MLYFFYGHIFYLLDIILQYISPLFLPFIGPKSKLFVTERLWAYQRHQLQELEKKLAQIGDSSRVFWLHISSAGELEQAIPICESLKETMLKRGSDAKFVVSYFSPSAKPFLNKVPSLVHSFALPLDTERSIKPLSKILGKRISAALFVRYEIWPCLMRSLKEEQIPSFLLGAVGRKTRTGVLAKLSALLQNSQYLLFRGIYAVSQKDRDFFLTVLASSTSTEVVLAGDPKWTRAKQRAAKKLQDLSETNPEGASDELLKHLLERQKREGSQIVVFGSPHAEEWKVLLDLVNEGHKKTLWVCAPPEIDSSSLKRLEDSAKKTNVLLSWASRQSLYASEPWNLLILDTMGQLADLYSISNIAVVGGGFDGQLHNTLEPAAFGVPVLCGNRISRAPEAEILLDNKALKVFSSPGELFQFLSSCSRVNKSKPFSSHLPPSAELEMLSLSAKEVFKSIPNTSEVVSRHILSCIRN